MPTTADEVTIRDKRRRNWFSVDKEIIKDYGPEIEGSKGIAVYATLACFAFDEVARVSITTMCKILKMGRTKLLEILALLKKKGLIDIEEGDRITCNTYTLLEVEKTPAKGCGPTQDHQEALGSPPQDHTPDVGSPPQDYNKTRDRSKTTASKIQDSLLGEEESVENDTLLGEGNVVEFSPRHQKQFNKELYQDSPPPSYVAIETVMKLEAWPKSFRETAEIIDTLGTQFPKADAEKVCADYVFYCQHADKKINGYVLKLRTFFKNADRWAREDEAKAKERASEVDDGSDILDPEFLDDVIL